jgi:hypothetical protein
MGFVDPMAITSVPLSTVLPFGSSTMLWGLLVGTLSAAAVGIFLSVPRRRVGRSVYLGQPAGQYQ